MTKEYIFEEYTENDRGALIDFMNGIFQSEKMRKSHDFNLSYWKWQYQENPSGKEITIIAKDNDKVIGQYANVPTRLRFDDNVLNSALVIDLMVSKDYRRKGLFKKMGDMSNSRLAELDIILSMAFPSRNESYAGFINKLDWFKIGNLDVLVKPIFYKLFGSRKIDEGIEIKEITIFSEEINDLWQKLNSSITIGIVRNKEYLNWRYFNKPNGKYRIFLVYRNGILSGYFVLKLLHLSKIGVGVIVDMLCLNEENIVQSIILKITDLLLKSGVHLCVVLKTKLYEDVLRQSGFRLLPSRFNPKSYALIVRMNKPILRVNELKNIDNWYLTFGDWDVV